LSSKIFTEVLKRFKSFTPLELKALSIVFNTFVQHNEFNLDDLVKAKHDDNGIKCPHCSHAGPEGIVKYGKRREVQWYKCKLCGRTFSAVTGTFLNRTKKFFQDWEDFIQCMMEGYSAQNSRSVQNTQKYGLGLASQNTGRSQSVPKQPTSNERSC